MEKASFAEWLLVATLQANLEVERWSGATEYLSAQKQTTTTETYKGKHLDDVSSFQLHLNPGVVRNKSWTTARMAHVITLARGDVLVPMTTKIAEKMASEVSLVVPTPCFLITQSGMILNCVPKVSNKFF